ncbi:MAG: hypothetical protein BWY31_04376 [Lentisphaerae bacterium ADurb.Bin242]|nr:MAG: hypothetical protein BWY31_04376 [Lentisphaerae bacterium ADurb.Bin242]
MNFPKEFIFNGTVESCHASTLLELKDSTFLVACFEGSGEGKEDVGIRLMHRHSAGQWNGQRIKIANEPHWNPVLFRLAGRNTIALYFKVGRQIPDWKTFVSYSTDEGTSWTPPAELVPDDRSGGRGPVKNKPILLNNGVIAAPASVERKHWSAFVDLSGDDGRTWVRSAPVPMPHLLTDNRNGNDSLLGVIQPTLWESAPDMVHMLLRSNNHRIYRSDSPDGGRSWCEIYPTGLPNNNSGIDLVKLADGTLLLLCNPISENWGTRRKLSLFLSEDNGNTWPCQRVLENAAEETTPAEFSYPAIISLGKDEIALTYTVHRRDIAFLKGRIQDFFS